MPADGETPGATWPGETWPAGPAPAAVGPLLDEAFDGTGPLAETQAVAIVHRGVLVADRYAGTLPHFDRPPEPIGPDTPLLSWSMAKSVLHAAVGVLVGDGSLDAGAPAGLAAWSRPGDPRAAITVTDLLRMRDGLAFAEDYVDDTRSDVIEMLFGAGAGDVAGYAAGRPLEVPPGSRFQYSSGTSNLLSAVVAGVVGHGERYAAFLRDRLLHPLGMVSARPGMDAAGTWVASSFVHATARDYARFGYLYLRDGVWRGRRILPAGWVARGAAPTGTDADGKTFGEHWWVTGDRYGTFWASGYEGQAIVVVPALDLVLVRLGKTPAERGEHLADWRARVIEAFA